MSFDDWVKNTIPGKVFGYVFLGVCVCFLAVVTGWVWFSVFCTGLTAAFAIWMEKDWRETGKHPLKAAIYIFAFGAYLWGASGLLEMLQQALPRWAAIVLFGPIN